MGTFDKYFENIHFDFYLIILKVYNIFRIIKGGFYNGIYFKCTAKYSLQGTTQGRYLTGGVPPVRFSM